MNPVATIEQDLNIGPTVRDLRTVHAHALQVLHVTRGNIRALGGARDPEQTPYAPYQVWLAEVEQAIADLEPLVEAQ